MFEEIISQLELVEVDKLLQHEQIIPENFLRLKEAMLNIGQLVDPIIIDKNSFAVLDGNHRISVLRAIKVPRAVCQMVDYKGRKDITLGTWLPVARESLSIEAFKKHGVKAEPVDYETGRKAVQNKEAVFFFYNGKEGYLLNPQKYDLEGIIEAQKEVLKPFNGETERIFEYISDEFGEEKAKEGRTVLFRTVYTKDEVLYMAKKGEPFPPKSTRHSIPNRIIRLNMRLGWLHQDYKAAWDYLKRMLRDRVYSGNVRRYSEPVIVIY